MMHLLKAPMRLSRRLYDWTLHWAQTPYALPALAAIACVEACFFPVPPDVLLIAIALGARQRAYTAAAICTLASTLGGVAGWALGQGVWVAMGHSEACVQAGGGALLFDYIPGFSCHVFEKVAALYRDNAVVALLGAAFTPIPFKVFTVTAGVAEVPLALLVGTSLVGRGARFFLVALLIRRLGPSVRNFLETRFELATLAFAALLGGGFLLLKWLL